MKMAQTTFKEFYCNHFDNTTVFKDDYEPLKNKIQSWDADTYEQILDKVSKIDYRQYIYITILSVAKKQYVKYIKTPIEYEHILSLPEFKKLKELNYYCASSINQLKNNTFLIKNNKKRYLKISYPYIIKNIEKTQYKNIIKSFKSGDYYPIHDLNFYREAFNYILNEIDHSSEYMRTYKEMEITSYIYHNGYMKDYLNALNYRSVKLHSSFNFNTEFTLKAQSPKLNKLNNTQVVIIEYDLNKLIKDNKCEKYIEEEKLIKVNVINNFKLIDYIKSCTFRLNFIKKIINDVNDITLNDLKLYTKEDIFPIKIDISTYFHCLNILYDILTVYKKDKKLIRIDTKSSTSLPEDIPVYEIQKIKSVHDIHIKRISNLINKNKLIYHKFESLEGLEKNQLKKLNEFGII